MNKKKQPLVALVYPEPLPWLAECFRGVKWYADRAGGWNLVTSPPSLRSAGERGIHLPALKTWRGDGMIACLTLRSEERVASRLPLPVVNLSGWSSPHAGVPRVNADHRLIGRVAAEHLLALGLRHFAYYGIEGPWYSEVREQGFVRRLAEAGFACAVCRQPADGEREAYGDKPYRTLARWLAGLPKPVGVLAVHDYRARVLIELCSQRGLAVPEQVAVLGVDNDPITCDYCVPSLSSVSRDPFACGVAAARLLHRLMKGAPAPDRDTLVPPEGVVQRRSTDCYYDGDPVVRRVIDYAASRGGAIFSVAQMAKELKMSRRLIEVRFRERLGITPLKYLQGKRIARARSLLLDTDRYRTLSEVASACGFGCVRTFREAFQSVTGLGPAAYRKRHAESWEQLGNRVAAR